MDNLRKSFLAMAAAGEAIAVLHAYQELTANFTACQPLGGGCGDVFLSGYVSIFGVPFYLLGLVWFPLLASAAFLTRKGNAEVLVPLLMVGNIFTVYLWYLELFRIGAVCPVCVAMYLINYAMTFVAFRIALR